MKTISEQSQTAIRQFLAEWWRDLTWKAHETAAGAQLPHLTDEQLYDQLLGHTLREIAAAAEGLLRRSEATVGETHEACQQIAEWMFARPGMPASYHIPSEFWMIPVGDLVLRALLWCSEDELISMSEAARLSRRSLSALRQYVDRGRLSVYPDPNEPNPTRRNRVKRSEVVALPKVRRRKGRQGKRRGG